jgi:hypothetical protein
MFHAVAKSINSIKSTISVKLWNIKFTDYHSAVLEPSETGKHGEMNKCTFLTPYVSILTSTICENKVHNVGFEGLIAVDNRSPDF